jgi:acetylornithine deacetylase
LKPLEEKWNESEIRHDSFKHMKHPVNFNLGKIHGGDWASSVAPHCTVDVRVGFYPGMTIEEVQKAVEAIIAEAAAAKGISYNINYNGFQAEGCVLDGKREFINVLAEVHKEVTGNECGFSPVTCTTDARHFQLYAGIPATCYGPEATNIHAPDESVSLDSMNSVAQVLAAFIAKWCGLEKL